MDGLMQSCNEDLLRFGRFLDSPPPQGKILPNQTKCFMYTIDLWSLHYINDHRSSIDIRETFGFNRPGQCPLSIRFFNQPSPLNLRFFNYPY